MRLSDKYNSYDQARIYTIVTNNDIEAYENEYPDLLPYSDNLFAMINFAKNSFEINNIYASSTIVHEIFE